MSGLEYEIYALKITYEKGTPQPSRVFKAMSEMIDGLQVLDGCLLKAFPFKIEPTLLLEDIQVSSLRTVVKNVLTQIDDEAIKNLEWKKVIGSFLLKGKHAVIEWIDKRDRIETRQELQMLASDLQKLAEDTKVLYLPVYTPPPLIVLTRNLSIISSAVAKLGPGDEATYESDEIISRFNKRFQFNDEFAAELLTHERITNQSEVLLRVKKPDYLGESMWEFKHAGHPIRAKIEDHTWLALFQLQKVEVKPGDSLRVLLETTTHHGPDGEELITYYRVLKILNIHHSQEVQLNMLPND